MAGRTRRVRLLAVGLCIFFVFFIYQRNEARDQVERYAQYLNPGTDGVGGGSVLRLSEKQEQRQEQEPLVKQDKQKIIEPAPTTTTAPPLPPLAPIGPAKEIGPDRTTTSSAAFELPFEVGLDRLDQVLDSPPIPTTTTSSKSVAVHWTKQPEKYPVKSIIPIPTGKPAAIPLVQKRGSGTVDKERLAAVKAACQYSWKNFREYGWDYDEVKPVSGGGQNSFNGWGATLVDSLDTLWIMGMKEEFEDAVKKTAEIDFTTSSRSDIPLFEVTIRYLGGMLAAYDISGKQYKVLLDKSLELAEILYSAFDTPNRMPETYYHWNPMFSSISHGASARAVMAEIGTLSLEFTRLAQLTSEPKYYDAIARITDAFEEWQNRTRIPGMWPTYLDASGCAKVQRKPGTFVNSQPNPQDNGNMISSQPVKTGPKLPQTGKGLDAGKGSDAVKGPEVLKGPDAPSAPMGEYKSPSKIEDYKTDNAPKMGSVANPVAMMHPNSDSSLRHGPEVQPDNKPDASIYGKIKDLDTTRPKALTNEEHSRHPLPPFGEVTNADKSMPFGPKDPLPPLGENTGHINHKRAPDVENSESGTPSHYPATWQVYSAGKHVSEDEDDGCVPQGFESTSKNSPETFTLGGASDSTYEYLPKMHLLLGGRLDQYEKMYLESMKPVVEKLLFRPMTIDERDILISGELHVSYNFTTGEYMEKHNPKQEHLTCFVGGMFAMGGKIFNIPEHVEIGRKITDGCIWSYNSTVTGIMAESFTAMPCASKTNCKWNQTAWYEELDPQASFRTAEREEFAKTYEIDDLEAYERKIEAAASASEAADLAAATATTIPFSNNMNTEKIPNKPVDLSKRQVIDPQLEGLKVPTTRPMMLSYDTDEGETKTDKYGSDYSDELERVTPPQPIYTPEPPPTHKNYVEQKIKDQRLSPGFLHYDGKAYILRPEAIESVFYMYRITGEQYWRDMGWKMFMSINEVTKAPYGHASIDDVTKSKPKKMEKMESFWIAETLKYFYLLFDDPDTWSLDDWVLNTEAHFFRRPENPVKA